MIAQDDTQFAEQAKQSIAILTKKEDKRELALQWSKTSERKVYAQLLRELMTLDARPELKKITCPATVLHSFDENANAPEEYARNLYTSAYTNLDGVRLHGIGDSFHFIMWDQPEKFLDTLKAALPVPTE
jgi:pimeloyl-ACP methyl ester carboxylesterase